MGCSLKILFLTDNFPPEGNAPATRTYEHAKHWVVAGHAVTVITGAPNFPEGELFEGYKNHWHAVEDMDGIKVVRVKTYITANEGVLRRTVDYLSFMVTSFMAGLFQPRPDVIIGTSPQFFTVCSAWMLSVFKWRPFVFELRDLWPASIGAVGAMREGFLLRTLECLELFLYREAAAVVSVTESFKKDLVGRCIDDGKIHVIRNGVEAGMYSSRERDVELAGQYELEGKFVVGFLGTHGMAHGLSSVLDAAQAMRDREDIVFLFVGSGAYRERLLEKAGELGLKNVRLVDRQPKEMMPQFWSLCDVSLITLKDDPLFSTVIPSKIFESMGMGLPIVISLPEGEATQLVEDCEAGITIEPENPEALKNIILRLNGDDELMGRLARSSAGSAAKYSRKEMAGKMVEVLESIKS